MGSLASPGGDDRDRWKARYAADARLDRPPSAWVAERIEWLREGRPVLDLACGSGRHAMVIAAKGRPVVALDFVESAVRLAAGRHPMVQGVVADALHLPIACGRLGGIVCVNFLERSIFPSLQELLEQGGLLIYETYTLDQLQLVREGRARAPSDPRYLLERGELLRLVHPLTVLDWREGYVEDEAGSRYVASVVARREALG